MALRCSHSSNRSADSRDGGPPRRPRAKRAARRRSRGRSSHTFAGNRGTSRTPPSRSRTPSSTAPATWRWPFDPAQLHQARL